MKFCSNCGKEINENAVVCLGCGCAIEKEQPTPKNSYTAIKVFMLLGCIITGIYGLFIPLIWTIPMTCALFKKIKKGKVIGTGFKICTLIFVSLIAGILLLCNSND